MIRQFSTAFLLVLMSLATRGALAAEDIKVCVDVTLRAPTSKPRAKDADDAAAATEDVAKTAASPRETPPNPQVSAVTSRTSDSPQMQGAPLQPLMVPYADQRNPSLPRVQVVDHSVAAEDAANIASEVDPQGTQDPRVQSGAHLPVGQTPTAYLKRLMEHFVTHEPLYVASQDHCSQRITVELYPLKAGWTAFARYSGTGREERVDQLLPTELSQFAERSVLALLHDVPIGMTVDRDNVLWADSLKSTQRIHGRNRFVLAVGTRVRAGYFDTLTQAGAAGKDLVQERLRLFTPMALSVGYRGQFDQFGVEAMGELDLGTELRAASGNPSGGHVDYGGSGGLMLHVLRYINPRGLATPYWGAGANFALHWFRAVAPEASRMTDLRSTLYGGGLDVDLVGGYEFMRASAVSFFLQGELNLPAYVVRNENNDGQINTWFPGAALRLGASF